MFGVIYFVDDDNIYDSKIFDEVWNFDVEFLFCEFFFFVEFVWGN